ncbi:MAG TPA: glycoside hydrolase family 3 [Verrucomicrobiales bacterium]|nr:glycoside hydrolase family 3 [Verrucomicrobiales bacterium]
MTKKFDPRQFPFLLDDEAATWVETVLKSMSQEQKLAQLINVLIRTDDPEELAQLQRLGLGSMARKVSGDADLERKIRDDFHAQAPVPLLITADLEGSRMSQPGGVVLPNPLGIAAVDDVTATERATEILAMDGLANGINWTFTPLLDINKEFRSAIVGTRSFGSDLQLIRRHMLTQIRTFQGKGVAATAKHWPGEGYDDRDQHLVTTINPLSVEEWEATFGSLYRDAIQSGVLSVMPGHIAFPAWVRKLGFEADAFTPATINRHLTQTLLRDHLGFNGVIVSDATAMAGLNAFAKRKDFLPKIISAGCDIILFSNDPQQDLRWLQEAIEDGRLSLERVDEAVSRILSLKARVGLHNGIPGLPARDRAGDEAFAKELHQRVPTLVKDTQNLLPISPEKHRRVLIISRGIVDPFQPNPMPFQLPEMMQEKGFEVSVYRAGEEVDPSAYDLLLYLFGEETLLTRNHIFIDWLKLMGGFRFSMQRFWHEVPTAMISFGYPYHLYDAPRVPTYINAYSTTEQMQSAVLNALLGETPWQGTSPVDPFCRLEDAKL